MIDIFLAVVIDLLIGDPLWFPHPVIYMGKLINFLHKKGKKISKSNKELRIFGLGIVLIVSFVSFILPFIILRVTENMIVIHHILNIMFLWTILAAKSLHKEALKVYKSLENNDIEDARVKLSYIVGRETSNLMENEIIRADVETVAENTSDGIIAPLFFAFIGGAPLAMMYKGINTMDSMLGYMDDTYKYIGYFPAKVDDVFNFVPSRITGIIMCFISPIVGGNIFQSLKIMFRYRKNHKSPNCAYPEGATAGALKIQLGGNNIYFGKVVKKPTIGDKIIELKKNHIVDSIKIMYGTEVLTLLIYFAIATLWKGRLF